MKAQILQHVPFETGGYILDWLKNNKFIIEIIKLYQPNISLPEEYYDIDLLIVMGGPMSVHDEDKYTWLKKEKQFIKNQIDKNIPVLGICLGAQLIANIYNKQVSITKQKEIGWFPIQVIQSNISQSLQLPEQFITFLWHGEQFEIPTHAKLFASSQACPHQAFIMKKNIIGLQFHPEITLTMIKIMIENCYKHDYADLPTIQSIQQMITVPDEYYKQNHLVIDTILTYLTNQNRNY